MYLFELNVSADREQWNRLAEKNGMIPRSLTAAELQEAAGREKALVGLLEACRTEKTVFLFADHGMQEGVEQFLRELPDTVLSVPVGSDAMLLNRGSAEPELTRTVNAYLTYGGDRNLQNLMGFLRCRILGQGELPEPPELMPFDGIFTAEGELFSGTPEAYFAQEQYPVYVGLLTHRSNWLNHTLQAECAIIRALRSRGIGVIPVFAAGEKSQMVRSYDFRELTEHFFSRNGVLQIRALVNFQMHLIKGENGKSIAQTSAELYRQLNIPVFHPIASYFVTEEQWERSSNPLASELQMDYLNPEMAGMIEPVLVALRAGDRKGYAPIPANVELFAERVKKWVMLGVRPNREKKIALMFHNAVCAGVEATLGKAFGMDAFESTVRLMKRLQREGYTLEQIPESGEELRRLILERKAFADFRWTSVEDIIACGGCLYRMPAHREYSRYFGELPEQMQKKMVETWGEAPGEGMVLGDDLIITGLRFGNFTVLVQPKRGCYGPKCTGEVCRILHDPLCPPTHQYLATYRYLERVWQADAVIHMGTDGSLEYLPGKASGMGTESWGLQVLGSLPNLYPYHLGVTSEGTVAKRRANALLIGYYPAGYSGLSGESLSLMDRLDAWEEADRLENGQAEALRREVEELLASQPALQKLLLSAPSFREGVTLVRSSLLRCAEGRKLSDLHVFGENPSHQEAVSYLCEVLRGEEALPREPEETEFSYSRRLHMQVETALAEGKDPFSRELQELYARLQQTAGEQDRLIDALSGRFQMPSEGGMPDENGRRILPAGRNFYMMNEDQVPTPTAFDRGKLLADQLLAAYGKDEGGYPRKIAMNMISLDISRTHGEQMSQFLWLLGVRPRWDARGRVTGLEPISLEELGRPRIDVTLRISGVMRDTWPGAVELMDQAVLLVSDLPETEEENYILYQIRQMEKQCGPMDQRDKTIRIFGDPPGAFGAGIDLALKASAWESDRDLARYFIQSSAFAYGRELDGRRKVREFVENARNVDLTSDVSSSRRMDTLSCGFGVQVQGGFRVLAETVGKRKIRQYQTSSELGTQARTTSLAEKVEEDVQQTLLNESWQDHMRTQGYTGAGEIMRRIQTAFDAQCTVQALKDETLDALSEAYLSDPEMREWLLHSNPYAAEEIGRRLLELENRGKWTPSPEVLERLRENYLTVEGFMEGGTTGNGEIQGGSVEVVRDDQVELWSRQLADIDAYLNSLS